MRRHALALLVVLCLAGSAAPAPAAAPDFKAMMRKTATAWQTLDPAKAAPLYAKDAGLAFFDLAPLKYTGWKEYEAGTAQMFSTFSSLKMSVNDDARTEQRGNVAWGTATVSTEVVNKDGSKWPPLDVRWTVVWEKRGSDWLIVHEHFSAPAPPPAAEKK